jgi:5'-nucleotidase
MKRNVFGAAMCVILLTGLAALVAGCGGVPEAMSYPAGILEAEKYIQEQLAIAPMSSQGDLARRYIPVQVLAINDFHGQISTGKMVSNRPVGSAPVLASYLEWASEGMEDSTFIVSAGDLVGASPPSSALLQDEPTIMFLNMLGNGYCSPQNRMHQRNNLVAIPGNHEFDEGQNELTRLVYGGNHPKGPFLEDPYEGAGFPFVCANVVYEANGKPLFSPFVLKNVSGVFVAFIGAVLTETPTIVSPSGVAGLEFLKEADSINAYVNVLKRYGIRSIVAVIHQGGTQTSYEGPTDPAASAAGTIIDIVKALDAEVDVVVSAHSHGFTNALAAGQNGKSILVTQAWSAGTAYADIDMKVDRQTRDVIEKSSRTITTWADAGPGLAPDAEVAALVRAADDAVAPLTNQVIGTAAADITRTQNDGGESALGNFIADVQRSTGDVASDFAFMNPGGIRADIYAGEVTWGELYTVQPFNNYLVKMKLTGQQIYDLLNQQWAGQPYPRVLQVSGLAYTWDNNLPAANRVVEVRKGGTPIDRTAIYTVTVNSFLSDGGDNFSVLKNGTDKVVGPIDLDALVDYIGLLPGPFSAAIEGRITRVN